VIPRLTDVHRTKIKRTFELVARYGPRECRTELEDLSALLDETIAADAPLTDRIAAYTALFNDVFGVDEHKAYVADLVGEIVHEVFDQLDETENGVYLGPRVG
jgi:hypothetical protein